ncbi:pyrimidine 5'-nucleotidase [Paracoccus sulfuroxidans]|uniref:Putative hydrolase of the HAD superfamily n=1 Tax=Paracoccus sulfuroxidans TaxID=384678 RepID=A0A562NMG3_9RHOB|nr:pyrimidine 5'-nucleotidase [Paracoccus sulfuroxidans]TWI32936.1 putative hydrolase of the HAD superfamily [Paracoccus sulfuroxidans]
MTFEHVTTWIFDLDNTLYDPSARLFSQIETRMTAYVMRELRVDEAEANRLRNHYWRTHGTTLAGLMAEHGIQPVPYLHDVHDIDMSVLAPNPALADAIRSLPGRKIVHTNGDSLYASKVLAQLQLDVFDAIFGVEEVDFHPKPDPRAYAAVIGAQGFDPTRAAMFEDDPRNLKVPHSLGMRTILVGDGSHGADPLPPGQKHGDHVQDQTADLLAFLGNLVSPGGNAILPASEYSSARV